jgi:hypothetical protein
MLYAGGVGRKRLTVTVARAETIVFDGKTAETEKKACKCLFLSYLIMQPLRSTRSGILRQFGLFGNSLLVCLHFHVSVHVLVHAHVLAHDYAHAHVHVHAHVRAHPKACAYPHVHVTNTYISVYLYI